MTVSREPGHLCLDRADRTGRRIVTVLTVCQPVHADRPARVEQEQHRQRT